MPGWLVRVRLSAVTLVLALVARLSSIVPARYAHMRRLLVLAILFRLGGFAFSFARLFPGPPYVRVIAAFLQNLRGNSTAWC